MGLICFCYVSADTMLHISFTSCFIDEHDCLMTLSRKVLFCFFVFVFTRLDWKMSWNGNFFHNQASGHRKITILWNKNLCSHHQPSCDVKINQFTFLYVQTEAIYHTERCLTLQKTCLWTYQVLTCDNYLISLTFFRSIFHIPIQEPWSMTQSIIQSTVCGQVHDPNQYPTPN